MLKNMFLFLSFSMIIASCGNNVDSGKWSSDKGSIYIECVKNYSESEYTTKIDASFYDGIDVGVVSIESIELKLEKDQNKNSLKYLYTGDDISIFGQTNSINIEGNKNSHISGFQEHLYLPSLLNMQIPDTAISNANLIIRWDRDAKDNDSIALNFKCFLKESPYELSTFFNTIENSGEYILPAAKLQLLVDGTELKIELSKMDTYRFEQRTDHPVFYTITDRSIIIVSDK